MHGQYTKMERHLTNKRSLKNNNPRYKTMDSLYYLQQWEQILNEKQTDIPMENINGCGKNTDGGRDIIFASSVEGNAQPSRNKARNIRRRMIKSLRESLERIPEELNNKQHFETNNFNDQNSSRIPSEAVKQKQETSDGACGNNYVNRKPRIVDVIVSFHISVL
ncbi:hypothetical protein WA026_001459 [Henosepilachna vigintioctopunctata]|uniref:Uncharacterized protein n=1 Tax=Henosepilachna vigintioctopunctata TaxID=420089 RepID=A0AAW1UQE9_9CUCU